MAVNTTNVYSLSAACFDMAGSSSGSFKETAPFSEL
jgi:hypothetical protein